MRGYSLSHCAYYTDSINRPFATVGTYAPYFGALVPLREQRSENVSVLELHNMHKREGVNKRFAITYNIIF